MALVLADRVREGTNTAGTGTVTLTGAVTGFASFASQIGNGNTTYYTITDGTNWEVGVGTYNANTLSRDTLIDSSTGSLINFAAGFKDVFVTLLGAKTVSTDTLATPPAIGGTTPAAGTFTTLIGGGGSANYFQTQGAATTQAVEAKALGSDTNIAFVIDSKGTGAIDLAAGSSGVNISNGGTVTAITRTAGGSGYGTAPTVTISAPTTAGGVQATATCTVTAGAVNTTFTITNAGSGYVEQPTVTFSGGGGSGAAAYATVGSGAVVRFLGTTTNFYTPNGSIGFSIQDDQTSTSQGYIQLRGTNTAAVNFVSGGSTSNTGITWVTRGAGAHLFSTNGSPSTTQLAVAHTASAVNYVQVTGAATTGVPVISGQGSDANVALWITSKGTNAIRLGSGTASYTQLRIVGTNNAVNNLAVTGTTAGNAPILSAEGTDTNIDLTLTPKGTGRVQFGTYTGTILTPTGYVEIKDSGGTVRRLLVG